ncbi:MAG: alkaline phosphatase family protein [Candidatus Bathyarchaeia archaeon]
MAETKGIRDLLRPLKRAPGLYRPNHDQNLFMVLPTAFDAIGLENERRSLYHNKRCKRILEGNECRDVKNVVFVVIDSCGIAQFALSNKLKRIYNGLGSFPLSSIFPTTTSTAIASIACGLPPEKHGVVGHKIYVEEVGALVDTLRASVADKRRDSLHHAGVDLRNLMWSKPMYSDLGEGALYVELLQWGIARTGLSHFLGVESRTLGFIDLIDAFSMTKKLLKKKEEKLIVHVYVHLLDSLGHKYGPYSKEYRLGLRRIEEDLVRFIRSLRGRIEDQTVLMVVSDHGHDLLDPEKRVEITREEIDIIGEHLRVRPGTSGRVRHFYVKESHIDEFVGFMEDRIVDRGRLLGYDEVRRELMMGVGGQDRARARIGDYVFVSYSGVDLRIKREEEAPPPILEEEYVSSHGSLTLNEIAVPFISARIPLIKQII